MARRAFLIGESPYTIDCIKHCGEEGRWSFAREKTIQGVKCRGCTAPWTYLINGKIPHEPSTTVDDEIRACEYWNSLLGVDISKLIYSQ